MKEIEIIDKVREVLCVIGSNQARKKVLFSSTSSVLLHNIFRAHGSFSTKSQHTLRYT